MNPILAKFQNQPALIEEGHGPWLESCLNAVAAQIADVDKAAVASENFWPEPGSFLSYFRPYVVQNGVLRIPVRGVLLNDFPYQFGSYATGYEYITQALKRGVADGNVRGIAFVVNSGGGMVSGNWDCVDRIYAAREQKPIRAYAAEHAYSAAYNIAAAAGPLTVARTGGVGSIGVVVTAIEVSRALENAGITVNIIRSKPDKMEGNAYEALSEGARERFQQRVDEFHGQFVAMVAKHRGMTAAAVDATDAHTFMAHQAVANGLADEIGSLDDALTAFEASLQNEEDTEMADIKQADHEKAVADAAAAAKLEGATEAKTRFNAIIESDVGKKRPSAALNAALTTNMSAEEATRFLATLPEEGAPSKPTGAGAPQGMFTAAMKADGTPLIEGDAGAADDKDENAEDARAKRALASIRI